MKTSHNYVLSKFGTVYVQREYFSPTGHSSHNGTMSCTGANPRQARGCTQSLVSRRNLTPFLNGRHQDKVPISKLEVRVGLATQDHSES